MEIYPWVHVFFKKGHSNYGEKRAKHKIILIEVAKEWIAHINFSVFMYTSDKCIISMLLISITSLSFMPDSLPFSKASKLRKPERIFRTLWGTLDGPRILLSLTNEGEDSFSSACSWTHQHWHLVVMSDVYLAGNHTT